MDERLDITVYRTEEDAYLVPDGRIVVSTCDHFRAASQAHISSRIAHFYLQLNSVEFIDSSGLGILVALKSRCQGCKTEFLALNPTPILEDIFRVSRLEDILEIVKGDDAEKIRAEMEVPANRIDTMGRTRLEKTLQTVLSEEPAAAKDDTQETISSYCKKAVDKVRLGEYQRAVELYQDALTLDPEYLPALNNLAVVYEKKPIWTPRAIETWENVLRISKQCNDDKHQERAERRLAQLREALSAERESKGL